MPQSFEDILTSMLEAYEDKGEQPFGEFLDEQVERQGFDEEGKEDMKKALDLVDKLDGNYRGKKKEKKRGVSRRHWLENSLEVIMEGRTDEEKEMIKNGIIGKLEKQESSHIENQ